LFLLLAGHLDVAVKTLRRIDPSARFDPPITSTTTTTTHQGRAIPVVALFGDGRLRRTLLTWLVSAMCMLLVYGLNTWLPRLMVSGGYPLVSSLSFLMLLNAGAVVGGLFGGWLSDRFGTRETLIVFFIGAALSLAALGTKPTPTLLSILLLVAGASTIGALSIFASFVAQAYPVEMRATAVSCSSAAGRIGAMAGPLLGGLILGLGLPFFQSFLAFAAPALLGMFALVALGKRAARDIAAPAESNSVGGKHR
jgi:AAHS family benzoate transporter-like MFS transporter